MEDIKQTGERKSSSGVALVGRHEETAGRFAAMCRTLNRILNTYTRGVPHKQREADYPPTGDGEYPYLHIHLTSWVERYVVDEQAPTRTGHHRVMTLDSNGNRRTLPSTIVAAIRGLDHFEWPGGTGKDVRVPVYWIVCYLHSILPPENQPGWECYECSHCCIEYYEQRAEGGKKRACVDARCLVWESKTSNQGRGHAAEYCCKPCKHCEEPLCRCANLHTPPCM